MQPDHSGIRKTFARRRLARLATGIFSFGLGAGAMAHAAPISGILHYNTASQPTLVNIPNFTPLIKKVGDGVVNISSTSTRTTSRHAIAPNPFPPNSPFHQFFRQFMGPRAPAHEKVEDLGSGFILTSKGYIVTAAHVVRGADHILVTLTNHKVYLAKLVGLSKRYDTALLKINAQNLPTAPIGNSSNLQVGQWLVAVGAPFGFFNTVTQGVVSAVNRSLPDDEYIPFIQTDVPINPGNSGGPLFNMKGQVIGINDQIYTNSGGYMGLSFSIPINTVMRVVNNLAVHKPIQFGWLGVEIQDVNTKLAEALHLKAPVGAIIAEIMPNSPAAKAGLKPGDVIVTYNGDPVYNVGQLPPLVGATPLGTRVKLGILRNGKPETLMVTIGALPKAGSSGNRVHAVVSGEIPRLHIQVQKLTPHMAKKLGIQHGVLIDGVGAGPAQKIGIAPGMVIQDMGEAPISSPAQFKQLIDSLPVGVPIPIRIRSGQSSFYTVIVLPPKK